MEISTATELEINKKYHRNARIMSEHKAFVEALRGYSIEVLKGYAHAVGVTNVDAPAVLLRVQIANHMVATMERL